MNLFKRPLFITTSLALIFIAGIDSSFAAGKKRKRDDASEVLTKKYIPPAKCCKKASEYFEKKITEQHVCI